MNFLYSELSLFSYTLLKHTIKKEKKQEKAIKTINENIKIHHQFLTTLAIIKPQVIMFTITIAVLISKLI